MRQSPSLPASNARSRSSRRVFWSDVTPSLGCQSCVFHDPCGGLQDLSRRLSCLDDCCGGAAACDTVCPRHPDFAERYSEANGFKFPALSHIAPAAFAPLPSVIPMIYHGNRREDPLQAPFAALPLFKLLRRADSAPRFESADAVRDSFKLHRTTALFLSGVDRDPPLERFWSVGRTQRRAITRRLFDLNIAGVSAPNYSTFKDVPLTDALHALGRIALVFENMRSTGMNTALHLNGITARHYERLADWITAEAVITHVSVDFGTGSKSRARSLAHATLLAALGETCGLRLHLVLRGGTQWLHLLTPAFASITILDTSSFCKTMWRQRAVPVSNEMLAWRPHPTEPGASLSPLLAQNIDTHGSFLRDAVAASRAAA